MLTSTKRLRDEDEEELNGLRTEHKVHQQPERLFRDMMLTHCHIRNLALYLSELPQLPSIPLFSHDLHVQYPGHQPSHRTSLQTMTINHPFYHLALDAGTSRPNSAWAPRSTWIGSQTTTSKWRTPRRQLLLTHGKHRYPVTPPRIYPHPAFRYILLIRPYHLPKPMSGAASLRLSTVISRR